ncbi:hypothetical protein [Novosphingobium sp. YAF33]|uniref:hypothetical protein n=1 Tax=Novosphingobium sp. YAF33 TaxID=3233082 RepID=UPI003F944655
MANATRLAERRRERRGSEAATGEEDVIFKSRTVKSRVGAAIQPIVAARKRAFRKCDNLRPNTKILVRFRLTYTSNTPVSGGVRDVQPIRTSYWRETPYWYRASIWSEAA